VEYLGLFFNILEAMKRKWEKKWITKRVYKWKK